MAISTATQAEMDQDEDDLDFRCQKCGAKNLVEMDVKPQPDCRNCGSHEALKS